jgi:hypothetical protein
VHPRFTEEGSWKTQCKSDFSFSPARNVLEKRDSNYVLTTLFSGKKDPQRNISIDASPSYMHNFVITSGHLQLQVIVFYDVMSESSLAFLLQHPHVKLMKTSVPETLSTNDYRFLLYLNWMEKNLQNVDFVLLADISDVVFFDDPFLYMETSIKFKKGLFPSTDVATFGTSKYIEELADTCFPEAHISETHGHLNVLNAGLWGGEIYVVACMLSCIRQVLSRAAQGVNCNMIAFNICAHDAYFSEATDYRVVDNQLYNAFADRDSCTSEYKVIHDKCVDNVFWLDKTIRLAVENGNLSLHGWVDEETGIFSPALDNYGTKLVDDKM